MNLQDELEKAWQKHKPWNVPNTMPPSMEFVNGFLAGIKIGESAESSIILQQRDWLLSTLWEYANLINNYRVHIGLDAIGHETCEACGGKGRVLDGEFCSFGDERVSLIKGL